MAAGDARGSLCGRGVSSSLSCYVHRAAFLAFIFWLDALSSCWGTQHLKRGVINQRYELLMRSSLLAQRQGAGALQLYPPKQDYEFRQSQLFALATKRAASKIYCLISSFGCRRMHKSQAECAYIMPQIPRPGAAQLRLLLMQQNMFQLAKLKCLDSYRYHKEQQRETREREGERSSKSCQDNIARMLTVGQVLRGSGVKVIRLVILGCDKCSYILNVITLLADCCRRRLGRATVSQVGPNAKCQLPASSPSSSSS